MAKIGTFYYANVIDSFLVTPSDTVDISGDTNNPRGYDTCYLYVLTAGVVVFNTVPKGDGSGTAQTLTTGSLTAGLIIPIPCTRVKATGTTASVVALIPKTM